jgi:hypothetical protein
LGEEEVDTVNYGKGGGFWNKLAFYKKEVIVADAKIAQSVEEKALASMTADEAKKELGESDLDEIPGDNEKLKLLFKEEKVGEIEIPEEYRKIDVAKDGTITIPAAACVKPLANTAKVAFMESWDGGWQMHYQRLGGKPQPMTYEFEMPAAGTYKLSVQVATVSRPQKAICRVNRRTLLDVTLPYTQGFWKETEPVTVELREGQNTMIFTCPAGNRGVSVKSFRLTPVK